MHRGESGGGAVLVGETKVEGREGCSTGTCPPSPRALPVAPDPCHLMIQHEQEGALDVEVSRPFHLEAISLLGGGHPVPLTGRRGADLVTKGAGRCTRLALQGTKAASRTPHSTSACAPHTPGPLTSTRWLSGPYSSLSSSMTRLLKNEENFLFCLLGWGTVMVISRGCCGALRPDPGEAPDKRTISTLRLRVLEIRGPQKKETGCPERTLGAAQLAANRV